VYQLSTFPHSIPLCPHPMTIHISIGPILQDIFSPSGPLFKNPDILPSAGPPSLREAQTPDLMGLQEAIQEKHRQEVFPVLIPIHDTHLLITPPAIPSFGTQSPLPHRRPDQLMRRRRARHPPPLPQPHRRAPPEAPQPPGTLRWWGGMYRNRQSRRRRWLLV
jgi:hypothetical protein